MSAAKVEIRITAEDATRATAIDRPVAVGLYQSLLGYCGWSRRGVAGGFGVLGACQVASTAAGTWSGGACLGMKAAAPAWRAACWVSSLS
jgi:hypothetical protein